MGSSAGERADALPRAGDICATIYDMEEHPTGDLLESDEPTDACADILRCLIEARRKAGLVESSPPIRGPNAACKRLSSLLKAELDRICTRVSIASTLSPEQIHQLIEDCDALSVLFRSSGDPKAKIFLRRLEMCRSFFEYSLQLQEIAEDPIDEP